MPPKQTTEAPPKKTRPGNAGRPPGKPGDYAAVRVYPGDQVGAASYILELVWEDWKNLTWDQLGVFVRSRNDVNGKLIGNRTVNVRVYGGPKRMAWFIPKKTRGADNTQRPDGFSIEDYETQIRKIWELEEKIKEMKGAGGIKRELLKALEGIESVNESTIRQILEKFGQVEEEDSEEEEELGIIEEALLDLESTLGPQAYQALKNIGATFITNIFNGGNNNMATQPGTSPAYEPISDQANDEFIELPGPLLDFLDTIDFGPGRTNPQTLIDALTAYQAQLGVIFKKVGEA